MSSTYHVSALTSDTPIPVSSGGTGSATATGTGQGVNATSPTLTTATVTGNTSTFATGVLTVTNTNTAPNSMISAFAASIANSQVASIFLGKDANLNNSIGINFEYATNGSSTNAFSLAFAGGSDLFKVTAAGVFTLAGAVAVNSLTSSSAIPVASGGTGVTTSTGTGATVRNSSPTFTGTAAFAALTASTPIPVSSGGTGSATATGTGQGVLDTSPTLTTPTFTGNTSTFSTGTVTVTNTNTTPNSMASIFAPNIGTATTASINLGKDATSNNSVGLVFEYAGNASTSNAFGIAFAGQADAFKIAANNAATFSGAVGVNSLTSSNAIPVTSGGTGVTTKTGTGSVVLSASPTFTGTAAFAALTVSTPIPVSSGGTGSSGSTGTGTVVLSVAPTITSSLTVDGNTSSFTNATLQVINNNSSPQSIANFVAPNLPGSNSTSINIGQSASVGNAVGLGYSHVGSNDGGNAFTVGFFGYGNILTITRAGNSVFTGAVFSSNITSGTWTPVFTSSSTPVISQVSYTSAYGGWVISGNQCTVTWQIKYDVAVGAPSSTTMIITGIPVNCTVKTQNPSNKIMGGPCNILSQATTNMYSAANPVYYLIPPEGYTNATMGSYNVPFWSSPPYGLTFWDGRSITLTASFPVIAVTGNQCDGSATYILY